MLYTSALCVCILLSIFNLARTSEHPGHLKRFGSSGPFAKLDTLSEISTSEFFSKYVKNKKALLIKGGAKTFPALKLWTDEYLLAASREHDDQKLVVETEKKESRDQSVLELSLREFLLNYKKKELYLVNSVPLYLRKDVPLPQPLQCEQATDTLEETVINLIIFNCNVLLLLFFFFGFYTIDDVVQLWRH
jgi:hypothetical protein